MAAVGVALGAEVEERAVVAVELRRVPYSGIDGRIALLEQFLHRDEAGKALSIDFLTAPRLLVTRMVIQ